MTVQEAYEIVNAVERAKQESAKPLLDEITRLRAEIEELKRGEAGKHQRSPGPDDVSGAPKA